MDDNRVCGTRLLCVMDRKIDHPGPFGPFTHFVNLIASHATCFESLGIVGTLATLPVDHRIDLGLTLTENRDMDGTLPDKNLIGHLRDPHLGIEGEDNDVIERRTFLKSIFFFQANTLQSRSYDPDKGSR